MNIKELRKEILKSKRDNKERSNSLSIILGTSLTIAKNDGNREVTEEDIIMAAKKEKKMTQQAKDSGAPYSEMMFIVSEEFLPKMMTEEELKENITSIIDNLIKDGEIKTPRLMGRVMGQLKKNFGDSYDGKIASNIVKGALIN